MQKIFLKATTTFGRAALCLISLILWLLPLGANSHEYWLEPKNYILEADETLFANLKNGVDFKGIAFPYIKNDIVSFKAVTSKASFPLGGRNGDTPALKTKLWSPGLHSISYHNKASRITFQKWEKFVNYVTEEGAKWVIQRHLDKGLGKEKIKEIYSRCAKSLVQVGPVIAGETDQHTGMPAELVAGKNPYSLKQGESLDLTLIWLKKPRPNNQIRVFEKTGKMSDGDQKLKQFDLTTDENGVASFVPVPGAEYLLSSVVLLEAGEAGTSGEEGVAWESYWASLTFAVPK